MSTIKGKGQIKGGLSLGRDKISHEWDGTILSITSSAGTSSVNLEGPRGERGPKGNAGTTDWNELENRPFGEETTVTHSDVLTWDGNTEGLVKFVRPQQPKAAAPSYEFYKVYDCAPKLSDLQKGGTLHIGDDQWIIDFTSENVVNMNTYYVIEVDYNSAMIIVPENTNDNGTELTKGVYFGNDGYSHFSKFSINDYIFEIVKTETKKIDPKYLPEHLQFGIEESAVNLQWDGNKNGKEVGCFKSGWVDIPLYKVSDKVFTADELKNITVIGSTRSYPLELYEEPMELTGFVGVPFVLVCISGINTSMNPALVSVGDATNITDEHNKAIFPSAGTYLADMSDPTFGYWEFDDTYVPVGYITSVKGEDVVKTLDTKFLPEPLQFGAETTVLASWDGNTDNVEIFDASTYATAAPTTYKISDDILTVEDILGSTVSFPAIGMEMPVEKAFTEPMPGMVVLGEEFVMLVSSEEIGVPLGVYATMPFSIYKETVTQIDSKYIPNTGGTLYVTIDEYRHSDISSVEVIEHINRGGGVMARYQTTNSYANVPLTLVASSWVEFGGLVHDNGLMTPVSIRLSGNDATITKGEINGMVYISRKLLIKGDNDNYYEIEVDSSGNLKASPWSYSPEVLEPMQPK